MTPEQQNEFYKCQNNFLYFFNNFVRKRTSQDDIEGMSLHFHQQELINKLEKEFFHIVLKARRMGITTIEIAYAFWKSFFFPKQRILIFVCNNSLVEYYCCKFLQILELIPEWTGNIKWLADDEVNLKNGSKINFKSTFSQNLISEQILRGSSLIIIDEAEQCPYFEELWYILVEEGLNEGRRCLISSTLSVHPKTFRESAFVQVFKKTQTTRPQSAIFWDYTKMKEKLLENLEHYSPEYIDLEYKCLYPEKKGFFTND
jgi:hypothetical protein